MLQSQIIIHAADRELNVCLYNLCCKEVLSYFVVVLVRFSKFGEWYVVERLQG
jgi:hypothetical protein